MISRKRSAVVRALKTEGLTVDEISNKMHLKRSSVRRYLRDSKELKNPKILMLDIETSPVWVRVWGLWRQRIPYQNVIKDWFMFCYAAQWLGSKEVISDCVTPEEALERDDSRICHPLWELMNDADIICGHNVDRFDLRKIMARFIDNGFLRPSPYRTIDTLTQSRKHFALSAHNLDYINSIFSLRLKEDTDYQLWIDCENGDEESLAYMVHYCESDVKALVDLYEKLRPYMTSHPNVSLYIDDDDPRCPHCGSTKVVKDGTYTTNVSVFVAYRCLDCGATPRGRKSIVSKEKREGLLVSTVR